MSVSLMDGTRPRWDRVYFEKWHGCRNDFIVMWAPPSCDGSFVESVRIKAPELCRRDGAGVAADGVMLLNTPDSCESAPTGTVLHIINSDGSLARNCGNGLRCAASSFLKYLLRNGYEKPSTVSLSVCDHTYVCHFLEQSHVSVEIGQPKLNEANDWHQASQCVAASESCKRAGWQHFDTVELGNRHGVLFGAGLADMTLDEARSVGSLFQTGDGLNVHFTSQAALTESDCAKAVDVLGKPIAAVFSAIPFERGVGITNACGSGASAVAAVAFHRGLAPPTDWVAVDMPGGRLYVCCPAGGSAHLAGPAQYMFCGHIDV